MTAAAQSQKRFKRAVEALAETHRSRAASVAAQAQALAEVVAARDQYDKLLAEDQLQRAIGRVKEESAAEKRKAQEAQEAQKAEEKAQDEEKEKAQKEKESEEERKAQKDKKAEKEKKSRAEEQEETVVKEEADFGGVDQEQRLCLTGPPGSSPEERAVLADSDCDSEAWQIAGKTDDQKAALRVRREAKRATKAAAAALAQKRLAQGAQQKQQGAEKRAKRSESEKPSHAQKGTPAQSRQQSLPPRQVLVEPSVAQPSRKGKNLFRDFPVLNEKLVNQGPPRSPSPETLESPEVSPWKFLGLEEPPEGTSSGSGTAQRPRSPETSKGKGKGKGKDKGKGKGKGPGKAAQSPAKPASSPGEAFDSPHYSQEAGHTAGYKVHVCDIGYAEKFSKKACEDFLRAQLQHLAPSDRPSDFNVLARRGYVKYTPLHGSAQAIVTFATERSCRMGYALLNRATWHHESREGKTQAFYCGPGGTRNK